MPTSETAQKFFDALSESYAAMLDAIKAANERGHRVSSTLIEEASKGQREAIDLAKKWAQAPTDLPGFYGSVVEATTKAQGRALELAREWFEELGEVGEDTREAIRRIVSANRAAAEAAVEAARSGFSTATSGVRHVTEEVRRAREETREPAPRPSTKAGRGDSPSPEQPSETPETPPV